MNTYRKSLALVVLTITLIGCVPEPETTTFSMINDGERELWHDEFGWLRLQADGEPASFSEPTCMEKCGQLFGGRLVCALGAQIQSAYRLLPGESVEMTWDGVYYEIDTEQSCYREKKSDADFRVTFCYGDEVEDEVDEGADSDDVIIGGYVADPTCEQQTFARGGSVELLAE